MNGYSVTEAASILGVSTERVWELLARGILGGEPDGEGMRVILKASSPSVRTDPFPGPDAAEPREPQRESSPFRELLTEFRNLTERYGQALLALGESRGEVASLRSRVDLLEARMDLRLPFGGPPADDWSSRESRAADAVPRASAAGAAVPPASPDDEENDTERRARRRRHRRATESFAEAMGRAEDPTAPELPDATEAAAALAALREVDRSPEPASVDAIAPAGAGPAEGADIGPSDRSDDAALAAPSPGAIVDLPPLPDGPEVALPRELPAAEAVPTAEEPGPALAEPMPTAEEPISTAEEPSLTSEAPTEPTEPIEPTEPTEATEAAEPRATSADPAGDISSAALEPVAAAPEPPAAAPASDAALADGALPSGESAAPADKPPLGQSSEPGALVSAVPASAADEALEPTETAVAMEPEPATVTEVVTEPEGPAAGGLATGDGSEPERTPPEAVPSGAETGPIHAEPEPVVAAAEPDAAAELAVHDAGPTAAPAIGVAGEPDGGASEPPSAAAEREPIDWDPERYTVEISEPDWFAGDAPTVAETVRANEPAPPAPLARAAEPVTDAAPAAVPPLSEAGPAPTGQPDARAGRLADPFDEPPVEAPPVATPSMPPATGRDRPGDAEPALAPPPPAPAEPSPSPAEPPPAQARTAPVVSAESTATVPATDEEEEVLWFGRRPEPDGADEMEVAGRGRRVEGLPGGTDLEDALAALDALRRRATAPTEPERSIGWSTPDAPRTDLGESSGETAVSAVPPTPASRAYRRLRRIFPG